MLHLQTLKQRDSYPWGTTQIYDRIEDSRIFMTGDFDDLSGPQKQQAIDAVLAFEASDYLSEVALEQFYSSVTGPNPFEIYAIDKRILSGVYDGCTRFTLLTEKDRYGWYFNEVGRSLPRTINPDALRNVGQPDWRLVNFPIEANLEREVRLGFWRSVGYENASWWIAWVPEHGYFEVNVPENFDDQTLQDYWQVADPSYRYVVVRTDGTRLGEKQF
ncbi:MAG: hypothetical protein AAGC54_08050 [Cyanobacteria bacterium P01_F01_bin.4]